MRLTRGVLAFLIASVGCGDNRAVTKHDDAKPGGDAAAATCTPISGEPVALERVFWGCAEFGVPTTPPNCLDGTVTLATSPPDDPRLFLVELGGRIRIAKQGTLVADPFLDISPDHGGFVNGLGVSEQGLLGLAFHPQFATNRRFYVYYTRDNPDHSDTTRPFLDVLEEYVASETDPDTAIQASARTILSIPDPYSNHNGGMIEFGRDGYLYVSDGDGGGSSTPGIDASANAQDLGVLLGKILRIDVDHQANGNPYAVPDDNPFVHTVGARPEIYVYGMRNPWRWSFDRATGDMYIGDVGQAKIEEIDVLRAGEQAGRNLGWSMWEGDSCYAPPCDRSDKVFPVAEYTHDDGWWAIIGGQVYRGSCFPDLVGTYFFTDTGHGGLVAGVLQQDGSLKTDVVPGDFGNYGASLHADASGELWLTKVDGGIFHLIESNAAAVPRAQR